MSSGILFYNWENYSTLQIIFDDISPNEITTSENIFDLKEQNITYDNHRFYKNHYGVDVESYVSDSCFELYKIKIPSYIEIEQCESYINLKNKVTNKIEYVLYAPIYDDGKICYDSSIHINKTKSKDIYTVSAKINNDNKNIKISYSINFNEEKGSDSHVIKSQEINTNYLSQYCVIPKHTTGFYITRYNIQPQLYENKNIHQIKLVIDCTSQNQKSLKKLKLIPVKKNWTNSNLKYDILNDNCYDNIYLSPKIKNNCIEFDITQIIKKNYCIKKGVYGFILLSDSLNDDVVIKSNENGCCNTKIIIS